MYSCVNKVIKYKFVDFTVLKKLKLFIIKESKPSTIRHDEIKARRYNTAANKSMIYGLCYLKRTQNNNLESAPRI